MTSEMNILIINVLSSTSSTIKAMSSRASTRISLNFLCELLERANLFPYEKPKFKDESGLYC